MQILKNETWKTIPVRDKRKNVVLDAHVLGHFGPKTTWERVEEDLFFFCEYLGYNEMQ